MTTGRRPRRSLPRRSAWGCRAERRGRRRRARTPTGRMNRGGPRSATIRPWAVRERRDRGWPGTTSSAPDVGLVVAAAMAPGTFAPSLSARSALDQGLVTGLATGLHYLLAAGAQDALEATARFLADGTPSPAARRAGRDRGRLPPRCPLGLARAAGPPAARRRPAPGSSCARRPGGSAPRASAARCSAARRGRRRGRSTTGCGSAAASPPSRSRSPSASAVAYVVDRLRAGEHAEQRTTDAERPARRCRPSPSRRGSSACLAGVAYGEHALTDLARPPAGRRAARARRSCGGWPATPASSPGWGSAPPRSGTGRCGGSRPVTSADVPVIEPDEAEPVGAVDGQRRPRQPRVLGGPGPRGPAARPRLGPAAAAPGPARPACPTCRSRPSWASRHAPPRCRCTSGWTARRPRASGSTSRWPSWSGPARSTGRCSCSSPRPAPATSTTSPSPRCSTSRSATSPP